MPRVCSFQPGLRLIIDQSADDFFFRHESMSGLLSKSPEWFLFFLCLILFEIQYHQYVVVYLLRQLDLWDPLNPPCQAD